jgi:hypothetical protein
MGYRFDQEFDASQVEPKQEFQPLPESDYLVFITESEPKVSQAGVEYLSLTLEVIQGEYQGRKLWVKLNLNHPDEKVRGYAKAELSGISRATGVMRVRDTTQLHDKPFIVRVGVRKRKDGDGMENRIKGYAPRDDTATPFVASGTATSSGAPQQTATGSKPWEKRS